MDDKIWIPPDETPQWVIEQMPVEEAAHSDLVWQLFMQHKPDWWNDKYGLGIVNLRRKQLYQLWKDGELERFPKDDQ